MEGSIHMGLGYALTEDFVVEGGHIVTDTIKSIRVLRAHQMPEMEFMFIETADPECPYGARGVGEIGLVPTAPAVAGALREVRRHPAHRAADERFAGRQGASWRPRKKPVREKA